ncbi:protocadherin Fat 2-like [Paramacrobiotus metropolitanus]|uniref:protocadherin Fat 2-like n=1 Tax=Paramacrobiotus metropolitanus TaxID=2943436 RepID=UPI002445700D|nr:protocadherin Fat 2-like [Paramacrobiotus metropolitanus]
MANLLFSVLSVLLFITNAFGENIVKRQVALTPTCGQSLYTGITYEQAPPGTFIVKATATSPVGNQMTWSIQDTTFGRFSINPVTGDVSVAGSLARTAMQRSALEFRIRATDTSNQLYCESTVRVNVQPGAGSGTTQPVNQLYFSQAAYTFTVGTVTYGTPIGQVSVNANGQYVTYSITGTNQFSINAQTGQITANSNLAAGTYTFTVTAQSSNGGTATTTVTVQVTSGGQQFTPPSFSQTSYSVQVSSCSAGTQVAQVQAGGSATTPTQYSLTGTSLFAIDPSSGNLSVAQNIQSGSYTFQIFATSVAGQATATVTAVVSCSTQGNANNQQYYFTSGSCPAGTQLGSICANPVYGK